MYQWITTNNWILTTVVEFEIFRISDQLVVLQALSLLMPCGLLISREGRLVLGVCPGDYSVKVL